MPVARCWVTIYSPSNGLDDVGQEFTVRAWSKPWSQRFTRWKNSSPDMQANWDASCRVAEAAAAHIPPAAACSTHSVARISSALDTHPRRYTQWKIYFPTARRNVSAVRRGQHMGCCVGIVLQLAISSFCYFCALHFLLSIERKQAVCDLGNGILARSRLPCAEVGRVIGETHLTTSTKRRSIDSSRSDKKLEELRRRYWKKGWNETKRETC